MKDTEENDTVYLYWRRCGRIPLCRSLLGDGPVEYVAVDLYWRRIGRVVRFRYLLGTV